ncbi:MAG: hypothetical protein KA248_00990 [Kiritimatiellae bacterium]|nr:hypothetical protein [Kiritimatiellia bacterium]
MNRRLAVFLSVALVACVSGLVTGCEDDEDTASTSGSGTGSDSGGQPSSEGQAPADSDAAEDDGVDVYEEGYAVETVLTAPTLAFPPDGYSNSSGIGGTWISLKWNAVEGAESYRVNIQGQFYNVGAQTEYVYATAVGTYTWQVAAIRGSEIKWSPSRKFTIVN